MYTLPARLIAVAAGLACGLALVAAPAGAQTPVPGAGTQHQRADKATESLPIRRITLYRSGVGSFERRGLVEGNATVQLRFTTQQINDILKSMVVLDMSKGQGTVEGISYGSKEPLSKRLSSFGVDIADNPSAAEVLQRLRGTPVKLRMPEGDVSGTVMNVETRPTVYPGSGQAGTVVHSLPWVNLVTKDGVRSYNLANATGFEIQDPALAEELNKALGALAEYRADRTKTVDIKLAGAGARDIVVAYVEEMPVWKASYRLVIPDEQKGKAPESFVLQGWAIVENTTDEDWNSVRLSLVSGRPVSFTMDLYEPLFLARPSVPVPTIPGVAPRTYAAGEKAEFGKDMDAAGRPGGEIRRAYASRTAAPAKAPGSPPAEMKSTGGAAGFADMAEAPAITSADMADYAARSIARVAESGEVFQYELENPVTVERQRSAMLPILSSNVTGRRVSIYSQGEGGEHPMRGLEVTNSTPLQLLPGPISVFDAGAYAGDAQIGHVPPNDKRLLAYAVDLDVNARIENSTTDTVRKVRWVKGMLEVTTLRQAKATYLFDNKDAKRPRTVVVEHARYPGWDLGEPSKPAETTAALYRFEVPVEAAKNAKLDVMQQHTDAQMLAFSNMSWEDMASYQKNGKVSQAVIDAFKGAQQRQGAINLTNQEIARTNQERERINTDQARIRQNMAQLDRTTELYKKYLATLTQQEAQLEANAKTLDELNSRLGQQQSDLANYLASLNVE